LLSRAGGVLAGYYCARQMNGSFLQTNNID
jgi:hypothetical protein